MMIQVFDSFHAHITITIQAFIFLLVNPNPEEDFAKKILN